MALKLLASFTRKFLVGVLLAAALPTTKTAWAQTETPATAAPEVKTSSPNQESSQPPPSWPRFEAAFQAGVALYREKKFDEARLAFQDALEKEPSNVQALTNLALIQFQRGEKGWALALLRRAQNIDPDFSTTTAALDFILPQLDVKEIPHEIQFWETFRSRFITPYSLNSFLFLTALSLFSAGWLYLRFFGLKKEAFHNEKPAPPFPTIPTLTALFFVASFSLSVLKLIDLRIPRATVINEKVPVYSAPSGDSVPLFDLYSGLEVVIGNSNGTWVQVTYPGASTGWVPKTSIFQTSGRAP